MSKEYKYTYRFSEQTVDTRYYKVESNKKLTQSEMQNFAWTVEGTGGEFKCEESPEFKATFEGTEYGDDAVYQMEEGEEDLKDDGLENW